MSLIRIGSVFISSLLVAAAAFAQSGRMTPRPVNPNDDTERVFTEEIKLNIAAFNNSGGFYEGAKPEDVVVNEDGVLHQASSLRRLPASVLILLDTGGEDRQAKDFKTTRETAKAIVEGLNPDDTIALMEYNDKAKILAEWTSDKTLLKTALNKSLGLGRRSQFVEALQLAAKFFDKSQLENRHLILITDGLDSMKSESDRKSAIDDLRASDINVHILSYTKMERTIVQQRYRSVRGGGTKSKDLPPGAGIPVQGQTQTTSVMTINLDRAMIRKIRERGENLERSEKALTDLAEDTNGILLMPESRLEMIDKASVIVRNVDANYVLTYVPKRPLSDVRRDEERVIEVTSRRAGLDIVAKRKLLVKPRT